MLCSEMPSKLLTDCRREAIMAKRHLPSGEGMTRKAQIAEREVARMPGVFLNGQMPSHQKGKMYEIGTCDNRTHKTLYTMVFAVPCRLWVDNGSSRLSTWAKTENHKKIH